jgi:hypothetical protein
VAWQNKGLRPHLLLTTHQPTPRRDEGLCSERALWLRTATTALIVSLGDARFRPPAALRIADYLEKLRLDLAVTGEAAPGELPCEFIRQHRVVERLATSEPANPEWQRDLSVSLDRLGEPATAQGDLAARDQSALAGQRLIAFHLRT